MDEGARALPPARALVIKDPGHQKDLLIFMFPDCGELLRIWEGSGADSSSSEIWKPKDEQILLMTRILDYQRACGWDCSCALIHSPLFLLRWRLGDSKFLRKGYETNGFLGI